MNRILTKFGIVAVAASVAMLPATAAPLTVPAAKAPEALIHNVQVSRSAQEFGDWRWRGGGWHRGDFYRGDRSRYRDGYRHRHKYWRGHRGYPYYRHGYRRHGDFWFPLAAFAAGAIISGAIASQPRVIYRSGGDAHVAWCYDRYRSYREWDNTWQPYHGRRRQCISPYS